MIENSTISGNSTLYGRRRSCAHMPTSGRLSTSSMTLPMYMLTTIAQNSAGFWLIINGPGCSPWMMKAPMSSAMTTFGGMPSVISGMKAPPRRGVVCGLGAGDALDGAAPEPLRRLRDALLERVGGKQGDHRAAAGQDAEEEAEKRAAHHRRGAGAPVGAAR